jgi:hypothetical protein
MEPTTQNTTPSPKRNFFRVVIIGAIILILIFLSIGIVKIVPKVVSSLASATVSITSLFSGNASTTPATTTGSGFVIVDNKTATATTTPVTDTKKPTPTKPAPTYTNTNPNPTYYPSNNGTPDLAVTIVSRGIINPANGNYVETNNFTTSDTVVIKFRIQNVGTAPTGIFNLSVSMPASNAADQLRQITNAASIPSGGSIDAQAVFTNPKIGTGLTVAITVDPSSLTRDANRANNVAAVGLNVSQGTNYTGGNTGNNTYNGQPDFIVQIMQVGTLNAYNQFVPTTSIPANGRVAVQFRVINQGNNANITNPWFFRAEMTDSGNPNKIYNSEVQAGLVGGQVVTYTLGFDNLRYGSNSITIYIDSQNGIYEGNENNNIASVGFNVY